jgi:cyanophycin synthetase
MQAKPLANNLSYINLMNKKYLDIAGNVFLAYYIEAAEELGVDYEMIVPSLTARFSYQDKHWFIITAAVPINNVPSSTISKRKNLTYKVLKKAGLSVAKQVELATEEDAIQFFRESKDIVLKPIRNLGGTGVTVLPRNEVEVSKAFTLADESNLSNTKIQVLGEEFIQGTNYRVLVLDDQVIGVVKRIPAMVIGDGQITIQKLIETKNRERKEAVLKPIPIDEELFKKLDTQNLTLESVPKDGEEVLLRFNSNLSTGGTTEECASEIHPKFEELAVEATKEIGLKLGGVDLIAEDITDPNARCIVNEINWNPGLRVHYMADRGERVKVAVPIMKYMMENL